MGREKNADNAFLLEQVEGELHKNLNHTIPVTNTCAHTINSEIH